MGDLTKLTAQEKKIAHLIAQGQIEKQIADQLCNSVHTIHTHTKNIRKKWGVYNIADITREYILGLERPKDVLKALFFLAIQFSIIVGSADFDLRRNRRVKVSQHRVVRSRY